MRTLAALALVLGLALGACAHAPKVQPIVITGHVLDAAGMTFEAVAAGMKSASDAKALTRDQVIAWNDFLSRWKLGYRAAADAWQEAKTKLDEPAALQAQGLLTSLLSELATWQFIAQAARKPQAYELPREDERITEMRKFLYQQSGNCIVQTSIPGRVVCSSNEGSR